MVYVTSIIDEDVQNKIDIQYIKFMLSHVDMNAAIVFICTNEYWRKEDTWKPPFARARLCLACTILWALPTNI